MALPYGIPSGSRSKLRAVGALEHHPRLQVVTGDPENRVVQGDCVDDTFASNDAAASHLNSVADDRMLGVVDTQGHHVLRGRPGCVARPSGAG